MTSSRAGDIMRDGAIRMGSAPYRPEQWSASRWSASYRAGSLAYYEDLAELGRYSVVSGYIGWVSVHRHRKVDVVDIGCGTGLLHTRLTGERVARYLGVDLSDAAIEAARRAAGDHTDLGFLVGDAAVLDLGTADVVVLNEMLYYVADLAPLLGNVEATATGGHAVVSMWRHPGDRVLWRQLDSRWDLVDRVDVRNPSNPVNPRGWRVALYDLAGPITGSEA